MAGTAGAGPGLQSGSSEKKPDSGTFFGSNPMCCRRFFPKVVMASGRSPQIKYNILNLYDIYDPTPNGIDSPPLFQ
jgi:hypothetical protein